MALVSRRSWSVHVSPSGMLGSSRLNIGNVFVQEGVPTRDGVIKHDIVDGEDHRDFPTAAVSNVDRKTPVDSQCLVPDPVIRSTRGSVRSQPALAILIPVRPYSNRLPIDYRAILHAFTGYKRTSDGLAHVHNTPRRPLPRHFPIVLALDTDVVIVLNTLRTWRNIPKSSKLQEFGSVTVKDRPSRWYAMVVLPAGA
ncbi:hypothetical protein BDV97DRAFT_398262 [Delphinella strobiligena]|nr:hypothetical protein BDV97DRAFT_398262 [Delphinella strobiligena]